MAKLNFPRIRAVTVTTTSQKLLKVNPQRKAVLIYNNGSAPAYLTDSEKSLYTQGIPIQAGSCYENDHFNPQGAYWIVCASGTVDIKVEETIQNA